MLLLQATLQIKKERSEFLLLLLFLVQFSLMGMGCRLGGKSLFELLPWDCCVIYECNLRGWRRFQQKGKGILLTLYFVRMVS